jgi:anthranilate phosphoribosyltransferase
MKELLKSFILTPHATTRAEMQAMLAHVLQGTAHPIQIASWLTTLSFTGLDRDPDILGACVNTILPAALPGMINPILANIVGTGGDGHNTFNVSTAAAIVVASCGIPVAKHGSRASSSACGAGDLLEAYGCEFSGIPIPTLQSWIQSDGFSFIMTADYLPEFQIAAPIRKMLGIPTIFNFLGPLLNPLRPNYMMVGVARSDMGKVMQQALRELGTARGIVVHGMEGLDELSPSGPSWVWMVGAKPGELDAFQVTPAHFGLPCVPLSQVQGGTPQENAVQLKLLLSGQLPLMHPLMIYVALNAAAVLLLATKDKLFTDSEAAKEAVRTVFKVIQSGKALHVIDTFRDRTLQCKK